MKRFHVHIHVDDLTQSVAFYSRLFAAEPARIESDYAKWMLNDPRVNFAISTRGQKPGLDHLGFQVDARYGRGILQPPIGATPIPQKAMLLICKSRKPSARRCT